MVNITIKDIARIHLAEGEILLVHLPSDATAEICATVRKVFAEALRVSPYKILVVNFPVTVEAIKVQKKTKYNGLRNALTKPRVR